MPTEPKRTPFVSNAMRTCFAIAISCFLIGCGSSKPPPCDLPVPATEPVQAQADDLEGLWLVAVVHRGCSPMSWLRLHDGEFHVAHPFPGDGCRGPYLPTASRGTYTWNGGILTLRSPARELRFRVSEPIHDAQGLRRSVWPVGAPSREPAAAIQYPPNHCDAELRCLGP